MQRHPSLASLSRDHHHALVLARDVRTADPPSARDVQLRFERELAPHFEVEERVLVARCEAFGEPLSDSAARVVRDHATMRHMIGELTDEGLPAVKKHLAIFGEALEAHVRYEERTWFPGMEEHLGADTLGRLVTQLRPAPMSTIEAFHQDEVGDFVADLACGHAQHVRHRPPFERRDWVTTADGRRARVGTALPCVYCRMPRLPRDVAEYKRTSDFDANSVPVGLTRSHTLKAGSWGEIVVTAGRVLYVLEDDGDWGVVLHPKLRGVIAPERPHHVELQVQDEAQFFVRFLRASKDASVATER